MSIFHSDCTKVISRSLEIHSFFLHQDWNVLLWWHWTRSSFSSFLDFYCHILCNFWQNSLEWCSWSVPFLWCCLLWSFMLDWSLDRKLFSSLFSFLLILLHLLFLLLYSFFIDEHKVWKTTKEREPGKERTRVGMNRRRRMKRKERQSEVLFSSLLFSLQIVMLGVFGSFVSARVSPPLILPLLRLCSVSRVSFVSPLLPVFHLQHPFSCLLFFFFLSSMCLLIWSTPFAASFLPFVHLLSIDRLCSLLVLEGCTFSRLLLYSSWSTTRFLLKTGSKRRMDGLRERERTRVSCSRCSDFIRSREGIERKSTGSRPKKESKSLVKESLIHWCVRFLFSFFSLPLLGSLTKWTEAREERQASEKKNKKGKESKEKREREVCKSLIFPLTPPFGSLKESRSRRSIARIEGFRDSFLLMLLLLLFSSCSLSVDFRRRCWYCCRCFSHFPSLGFSFLPVFLSFYFCCVVLLFHLVSLFLVVVSFCSLSLFHSWRCSLFTLFLLCLREERENKKGIRREEEGLKEWENERRGNPCLLLRHHLVCLSLSLHPLLLTLLLDLLVIPKPVIAFPRIPCHWKKSDLRRRWLKLAKC